MADLIIRNEISKISEIDLKNIDHQSLVLIDIDGTLIERTESGSEQIIDNETVKFIQSLQRTGATCIGFTSRALSRIDETIGILKKFDIDFTGVPLGNMILPATIETWPNFQCNIVFTDKNAQHISGDNEKGDMLYTFIEKLRDSLGKGLKFKTIVFIDNSQDEIDSVLQKRNELKLIQGGKDKLTIIPYLIVKETKAKKISTSTTLYESSSEIVENFRQSKELFPKNLMQLQYTGHSDKGSIGVFYLQDRSTGKNYTFKCLNDPDLMKEEILADAIYDVLDVLVPGFAIYNEQPDLTESPIKCETMPPYRLSEFIEGAQYDNEEIYKKIRQHFVIDVFMGNRDVVVGGLKNVIVDIQGRPYRIDNGGSLRYTSLGKKKCDEGNYDITKATELYTLRDPKINPDAAKVYGSITDEEIREQIRDLLFKQSFIFNAIDNIHEAIFIEDVNGLKNILANRLKYLEIVLQGPNLCVSHYKVAESNTAAGILSYAEKNGTKSVLLGKRVNHGSSEDVWSNFGGKSDIDGLNKDLTLADTASREVIEESNELILISPMELRNYPSYDLIFPDVTYRMYIAPCGYFDPNLVLERMQKTQDQHQKEYTEFAWIKLDDVIEAANKKIGRIESNGINVKLLDKFRAMLEQPQVIEHLKSIKTGRKTRELHTQSVFVETLPNIEKLVTQELDVKDVMQQHKWRVTDGTCTVKKYCNSDKKTVREEIVVPESMVFAKQEMAESFITVNPNRIAVLQSIKGKDKVVHAVDTAEVMDLPLVKTEVPALVGSAQETVFRTQTDGFLLAMKTVDPEFNDCSFVNFLNSYATDNIADDKQFCEILNQVYQNEQKNSGKFVVYHATVPELAFCYDVWTAVINQLNFNKDTDIRVLRWGDEFFKELANVQEFIMYSKKESNSDHINNYKGNYQECGLSVNFALPGSYSVPGSFTCKYFYESLSSVPPDVAKLLTAFLVKIGAPVSLASYMMAIIKKCFTDVKKNGRLLQILIDPSVLNDILYLSYAGGKLLKPEENNANLDAKYMLTLLRTRPDKFLEEIQKNNVSTKVDLCALQARLFMKPEIMLDPNKVQINSYSRYALSEYEKNEYMLVVSNAVRQILSYVLSSNTTDVNSFYNGRQPLQRHYQYYYQSVTGQKYSSDKITPIMLLKKHIDTDNVQAIEQLTEENPKIFEEKMLDLDYRRRRNDSNTPKELFPICYALKLEKNNIVEIILKTLSKTEKEQTFNFIMEASKFCLHLQLYKLIENKKLSITTELFKKLVEYYISHISSIDESVFNTTNNIAYSIAAAVKLNIDSLSNLQFNELIATFCQYQTEGIHMAIKTAIQSQKSFSMEDITLKLLDLYINKPSDNVADLINELHPLNKSFINTAIKERKVSLKNESSFSKLIELSKPPFLYSVIASTCISELIQCQNNLIQLIQLEDLRVIIINNSTVTEAISRAIINSKKLLLTIEQFEDLMNGWKKGNQNSVCFSSFIVRLFTAQFSAQFVELVQIYVENTKASKSNYALRDIIAKALEVNVNSITSTELDMLNMLLNDDQLNNVVSDAIGARNNLIIPEWFNKLVQFCIDDKSNSKVREIVIKTIKLNDDLITSEQFTNLVQFYIANKGDYNIITLLEAIELNDDLITSEQFTNLVQFHIANKGDYVITGLLIKAIELNDDLITSEQFTNLVQFYIKSSAENKSYYSTRDFLVNMIKLNSGVIAKINPEDLKALCGHTEICLVIENAIKANKDLITPMQFHGLVEFFVKNPSSYNVAIIVELIQANKALISQIKQESFGVLCSNFEIKQIIENAIKANKDLITPMQFHGLVEIFVKNPSSGDIAATIAELIQANKALISQIKQESFGVLYSNCGIKRIVENAIKANKDLITPMQFHGLVEIFVKNPSSDNIAAIIAELIQANKALIPQIKQESFGVLCGNFEIKQIIENAIKANKDLITPMRFHGLVEIFVKNPSSDNIAAIIAELIQANKALIFQIKQEQLNILCTNYKIAFAIKDTIEKDQSTTLNSSFKPLVDFFVQNTSSKNIDYVISALIQANKDLITKIEPDILSVLCCSSTIVSAIKNTIVVSASFVTSEQFNQFVNSFVQNQESEDLASVICLLIEWNKTLIAEIKPEVLNTLCSNAKIMSFIKTNIEDYYSLITSEQVKQFVTLYFQRPNNYYCIIKDLVKLSRVLITKEQFNKLMQFYIENVKEKKDDPNTSGIIVKALELNKDLINKEDVDVLVQAYIENVKEKKDDPNTSGIIVKVLELNKDLINKEDVDVLVQAYIENVKENKSDPNTSGIIVKVLELNNDLINKEDIDVLVQAYIENVKENKSDPNTSGIFVKALELNNDLITQIDQESLLVLCGYSSIELTIAKVIGSNNDLILSIRPEAIEILCNYLDIKSVMLQAIEVNNDLITKLEPETLILLCRNDSIRKAIENAIKTSSSANIITQAQFNKLVDCFVQTPLLYVDVINVSIQTIHHLITQITPETLILLCRNDSIKYAIEKAIETSRPLQIITDECFIRILALFAHDHNIEECIMALLRGAGSDFNTVITKAHTRVDYTDFVLNLLEVFNKRFITVTYDLLIKFVINNWPTLTNENKAKVANAWKTMIVNKLSNCFYNYKSQIVRECIKTTHCFINTLKTESLINDDFKFEIIQYGKDSNQQQIKLVTAGTLIGTYANCLTQVTDINKEDINIMCMDLLSTPHWIPGVTLFSSATANNLSDEVIITIFDAILKNNKIPSNNVPLLEKLKTALITLRGNRQDLYAKIIALENFNGDIIKELAEVDGGVPQKFNLK